jgi:hypothetical protein
LVFSYVLRTVVAGDIGGSMGLFIGASVITLIEAIDAFAIALANRRRKKKRQCLRSSKEEAETEI